jgi:hypothetical protein
MGASHIRGRTGDARRDDAPGNSRYRPGDNL